MFGIEHGELVAGLEAIRQRLCCYYTPNFEDRCDCKFGASGNGEQTGCPELRQAIMYLKGREAEVALARDLFEQNAKNTVAEVKRVIDRYLEQ